jgi:1-acyl-sn-glycerol-3-phosphate acyltransferase
VIPARKSPLFTRWFVGDAHRRIRRTFGAVHVRGIAEVRRLATERPILIVSNHTAWWDPLLILDLCVRVLRVDAYAMMDAKNLRRLPFFAKVGAFGVDLDDPRDGARAMRFAAKLLDRPGRLVWIFAQGREVPTTARPLGFRRGSAEIARVARQAVVVPVAIRYEHGSRPDPSIYVSFGPAIDAKRDVGEGAAQQEAAVSHELDRIDRAIVTGETSELVAIYERQPSCFMQAAERALAWLAR